METEKNVQTAKTGTATGTEKKALGRGLAALLGGSVDLGGESKTAPATTASKVEENASTQQIKETVSLVEKPIEEKKAIEGPFQMVSIDKIQANSEQPRQNFSESRITELAESIKEQGLIQPIILKKLGEHSYQIVAGERRWRASKMAGLAEIPAIIRDAEKTEESHDLASIIENIQRVELNPIELSEAYNKMLKKYGLTQEDLSKKLGVSRVSLANTLRLQRLPTEIKDAVVGGQLSEGHARALLGLDADKDIIEVGNLAIELKLNVRETEARVRGLLEERAIQKNGGSLGSGSGAHGSTSGTSSGANGSKDDEKSSKPAEILAIEDELRSLFGTKVQIRGNHKGGTIELFYANSDSFNRLIHQLRSVEK